MNRLLAHILGPELLWVVFFIVCGRLVARNHPHTPAGNEVLERCTTIGAFLAVVLTFVVFAIPGPNRWLLLLRVFLAVAIGLNVCLVRVIGGIDYGDSRNSGVLGFWVYGILCGGLALIPGLITAIVLIRRGRA